MKTIQPISERLGNHLRRLLEDAPFPRAVMPQTEESILKTSIRIASREGQTVEWIEELLSSYINDMTTTWEAERDCLLRNPDFLTSTRDNNPRHYRHGL